MKILHRARGRIQELAVTREGDVVTLWFEGKVRQTVFDRAAPHLPGLEYARCMLASLVFYPRADSCLVLGLGGGSIPRMMLAARPQMRVEAVEIDPDVVEVASRYFEIGALPRFAIHLEDAAAFLGRRTSRYGIVLVDTYIGETFPDRCLSGECFRDIRESLHEEGVLAINWLTGNARLEETLLKNLESAFDQIWMLPCRESHNVLYFASTRATTHSALLSAAAAVEAELPFDGSLKRLALLLRSRQSAVGGRQ